MADGNTGLKAMNVGYMFARCGVVNIGSFKKCGQGKQDRKGKKLMKGD